jgi:electron transport complex protein RnfD
MYGFKLLLMILIAIIATIETEILFYTIDKDINRQESKELIKKSYPKITALIYVLLIPIGTPLWLVGLGAILATLLGKLLFGGFHHMVFHSSLVGVIFVTLGWPGLVDSVPFMTSFDNYIIDLIFNNSFFNETLSIGNLYDPASIPTLDHILNVISDWGYFGDNSSIYSLKEVFIGISPGVIAGAVFIIPISVFLVFKKAINWVTPVSMILSFTLIAWIIAITNKVEIHEGLFIRVPHDMSYIWYQLFSGSFLFVVIFITTDPITTPINDKGKIIFGLIAGSLTMLIRNAGTNTEGVFYAVGFMMMLTPMINAGFKAKPKKKALPKKEGA